MAKTKGGAKKPFRNKKEYQRHLREMVKQGKSTDADGSWSTYINNAGMHAFLVAGYKIH